MTQTVDRSRPSLRERRKRLSMMLTGVFMLLYAVVLAADIVLEANLFWLTAICLTASVASAVVWARLLDEAKLNAHYIAWFWGGSAGLMVSALVFVALLPTLMIPGGIETLMPASLAHVAVNASFIAGLLLGLAPPTVGYLVWWAALSLQRR